MVCIKGEESFSDRVIIIAQFGPEYPLDLEHPVLDDLRLFISMHGHLVLELFLLHLLFGVHIIPIFVVTKRMAHLRKKCFLKRLVLQLSVFKNVGHLQKLLYVFLSDFGPLVRLDLVMYHRWSLINFLADGHLFGVVFDAFAND